MEPCRSERTEGIRAFQLPGQGPKPSSVGLEPALLGCLPQSPHYQGMDRLAGWDSGGEKAKRRQGRRGHQAE